VWDQTFGYQKVKAQNVTALETIKTFTDRMVISALERNLSRDATVSTTLFARAVGVAGKGLRTS
jgi:hypothetical protein